MKTLGLIGGMSWESTKTYYEEINRHVRAHLGGLHSSKCVTFSFDFAEIEYLQTASKWDEAKALINDAAAKLKLAGADAILLCTNTMHFVSDEIELTTQLPLIHIADATGESIKRLGFRAVGLLGTRFTMEKDFYKARLEDKFGFEVLVPDQEGRNTVHDIIYNELCEGKISAASKTHYQKIIQDLQGRGAECVILGCTEIGLLIQNQEDSVLPIFDTAQIHATAAAEWQMS